MLAREQLDREHDSRQDPDAKLQGLDRPPMHLFLPVGDSDLVFLSLRMKVFQLDPVSATPISNIIRHSLNDAQVFDLLNDCNPEADSTAKRIGHARLRRLMKDAREEHARRLSAHGLEDVDIFYACKQPVIETYKKDQVRFEKAGGKAYHLWPFDAAKQRMGMSVIIRTKALEIIFSDERCHRDNITIIANTASLRETDSAQRIEKWRNSSDFAMLSETLERGRSVDKVDRVVHEHDVTKYFIKSVLPCQRARDAPDWTAAQAGSRSKPVMTGSDVAQHLQRSGQVGANLDNEWWQKDEAERFATIEQWKEISWDPETRNYRKGDHIRLPGVYGNEVCTAYGSSRNYEWWEENVRSEEVLERTQRELEYLKYQYPKVRQQVHHVRAHVTINLHDLSAQQAYRDAVENENKIKCQIVETRRKIDDLQAAKQQRKVLEPRQHVKSNTDEVAKARLHFQRIELQHTVSEGLLEGALNPEDAKLPAVVEKREAKQSRWRVAEAAAVVKRGIFEVLTGNVKSEIVAAGSQDPTLPALVPSRGTYLKLGASVEADQTGPTTKTADTISIQQTSDEAMRDAAMAQAEQMVAGGQAAADLKALLAATGRPLASDAPLHFLIRIVPTKLYELHQKT